MLLQFYVALYTSKHFCIYRHLPLVYLCITPLVPVAACATQCTLYFCTFAFASYPFTLPFLDFSLLHCSTVLAVIRFLVSFYLHIFYLAFARSHFEFLFQSLKFVLQRMLVKYYWYMH